MSRYRPGFITSIVVCALLGQALVTDAALPIDQVLDSAGATAVATPGVPDLDAVSVFQTGELTAPIRDAALAAAQDVGAPAVVGRGFSAGMTRLRRGATVIQHSTATGWAFPMAITALPLNAIGAYMGRAVSGPISQGLVVMSQMSASIRGAQVGDTVDLMAANGGIHTFTIGAIAGDDAVGGTEIVISTEQADILGATIPTRVLIYGPLNRTAMQNALVARGLYSNSKVRVRKTWDAPDPDSTLSMVKTKTLMGEFDIDYAHLTDLGWTSLGAAWRAAYLPATRETYPTGIKAMCNKVIKADLTAALQEVVNSGLAGGIDFANANAYGGCATGQARLARITQSLGSVSRHSWGQPLDTNTTTNCQGCTPHMDCRIVRIFRKHNFAWGGNFLTSDGMHFEWVGEPRNTLQYPSKYCQNVPSGGIQRTNASPPPASRSDLFADDGISDE